MNEDRERPAFLWVPLRLWTNPEPVPDWQKAKIDAACDFWELQLMGIKG